MADEVKMRRMTKTFRALGLEHHKTWMEVEVDGKWYRIRAIMMPSQYTGDRPNLLKKLQENNVMQVLKVSRPTGKKIYIVYRYTNNQFKFAA